MRTNQQAVIDQLTHQNRQPLDNFPDQRAALERVYQGYGIPFDEPEADMYECWVPRGQPEKGTSYPKVVLDRAEDFIDLMLKSTLAIVDSDIEAGLEIDPNSATYAEIMTSTEILIRENLFSIWVGAFHSVLSTELHPSSGAIALAVITPTDVIEYLTDNDEVWNKVVLLSTCSFSSIVIAEFVTKSTFMGFDVAMVCPDPGCDMCADQRGES